ITGRTRRRPARPPRPSTSRSRAGPGEHGAAGRGHRPSRRPSARLLRGHGIRVRRRRPAPDATPLLNGVPQCPVPISERAEITIGHGGGGRLTEELINGIFRQAFANPALECRHDGAVLQANGPRLAFTTDAHVVSPLFFPGGDIGRVAVNGTVNDLAMSGARPLWLSAGFVLEEGLPIEPLRRVAGGSSRPVWRCTACATSPGEDWPRP